MSREDLRAVRAHERAVGAVTSWTVAACLAASALVGGCETGSGDHPRFEVALDPARAFSSLSDPEAIGLCRAAERFVEVVYTEEMTIRTLCLDEAMMAGETGGLAACEAGLTACIDATAPLPPVDLSCDTRTAASYPDCLATVGEVVRCADAASRAVVELLWPLDCAACFGLLETDDPGLVFEEAMYALEDGPCANVALACPTFYEGLRLAAIQSRAFVR